MAYPLEQGLKLGNARRIPLTIHSLNGLSTRTRIETSALLGRTVRPKKALAIEMNKM